MGYSNAGLRLLIPRIGGGPQIFYYSNTDAHGTVAGASYFSDGVKFGMAVNDVVIVVDTDSATCTIHSVASVSGNAATINAATLA